LIDVSYAVHVSGWTFSSWSDDLSGNTNPESMTMDSDHTVTATFTLDVTPTVNAVALYSYSDHIWVSAGGSVKQGDVIRIIAYITNSEEPVSISYGPSGGTLTTVKASYNSDWDYCYIDWTIPVSATIGSYDIKVDSGSTSFTASGAFQVAALPNY
jgi:ABC-type glycerol-3-phosphate transport system substrate-binding protein